MIGPRSLTISTLLGIELWSTRQTTETARVQFITRGFEFALPAPECRTWISGMASFQGKHKDLTGHEMVLLQPGEVWRCALRPSQSLMRSYYYHHLHVDTDKIGAYVPEDSPGGKRRLSCWAACHPTLTEAFDRLCGAFEFAGTEDAEREYHLGLFLVRAFELSDDSSPRRRVRGCERAVRRARELIEDSYATHLSLAKIAESVSLSVYHLERSFSERLGVPMHKYIQLVRVQRCVELLRDGIPPTEAWTYCGFSDQAHMNRNFRRTVGLTPGQIAQKLGPHRGARG